MTGWTRSYYQLEDDLVSGKKKKKKERKDISAYIKSENMWDHQLCPPRSAGEVQLSSLLVPVDRIFYYGSYPTLGKVHNCCRSFNLICLVSSPLKKLGPSLDVV